VIGTFTLRDPIPILQYSSQPSSRTTLRLDVEALLPGTVSCVVKSVAVTQETETVINAMTMPIGLSAAAAEEFTLERRQALLDFLGAAAGTLATATAEVPEAVPPNVTIVLVMAGFTETPQVRVWCKHSAAEASKITKPEEPEGQEFTLPGENPIAHTLPSFLWPGASFLIWMENVHDTTLSRVKLVNKTTECDSASYDDAVPVAQVANGEENPIPAYLLADGNTRAICFFELPTSFALAVKPSSETGAQFLEFTSPVSPGLSMIVVDTVGSYIHRGLPVNLMLSNSDPGETGQVFVIPDTEHESNDGHCLPPIGIDADPSEAESTEDYIERVSAIGIKDVALLPSPLESFTHFIVINEGDTANFVIGYSYTVCYVGSTEDLQRVFNKVGKSIPVRDVIVAMSKHEDNLVSDPIEQTDSSRMRLKVLSSMTGTLSCMACAKQLERVPERSEIRGDYAIVEAEEFAPAFDENDILGRTYPNDVVTTEPNTNATVIVALNPETVPNIGRQPLGVQPLIYAWCYHSLSSIIFPNNGEGIEISLNVYPPPEFKYATPAGKQLTTLVLARSVMFPPLKPDWTLPNFPLFYFDDTFFTITPPLPAGISQAAIGDPDVLGQLTADPVPEQLSVVPVDYTIKAQSKFDVQKSATVGLSLSVHEPAYCELQNTKSVEVVVQCTVHDADNMYNQAIYVLVSKGQDIAFEKESFSQCFGDASAAGSDPDNLVFTCVGSAVDTSSCCCYLWLPQGSETDTRDVSSDTTLTARIKNNQCGVQEYTRYDVMTLAWGVNPLMDNEEASVVWSKMFDFTVPAKPPNKPVEFTMRVEIDYDEVCDPVKNGEAALQACKDGMKDELVGMLGAPPEMVVIKDVQPAD